MGIVVLTDLYKVLLIKSIISNHVNPLYSWSTYINTDKNNPENKEEDTATIPWLNGRQVKSNNHILLRLRVFVNLSTLHNVYSPHNPTGPVNSLKNIKF